MISTPVDILLMHSYNWFRLRVVPVVHLVNKQQFYKNTKEKTNTREQHMQHRKYNVHKQKEPVRQASHIKVVWTLLSVAIDSSVCSIAYRSITLVCVCDGTDK